MSLERRPVLAMGAPGGARRGRHFVHDFRGTPEQVGVQHGRALAREIRAEAQPAAEALARRQKSTVEASLRWARLAHEGLFREHLPEALEEIRGIGEGAGLDYDYAFFAATRDMTRFDAGCTSIVAGAKATAGGGILMGQTKDTEAPLERFQIMRIAYASGRRMVLLNYPGWIANLGITSDGLCSTGNSLYAAASAQPTAPGSFLKRLILEKSSVREVLDSVRGMRFENGCLTIADASGQAVCMEMAAGRVELRDVSGQAHAHANQIQCGALKGHEKPAEVPASSPRRQAAADRLLEKQAGAITADSLQQLFRDHQDFPLSICRHFDPRDLTTTNAAFVADLKRREMHIAIGNPCVAPFERYALPA